MLLVEQVGEVRPRPGRPALDRVGRRRRPRIRRAAHRVERGPARGRPGRDQEHVRRLAPAEGRFEQVVLQHEVACVLPVVGDLARSVVPHHVGAGRVVDAGGSVRIRAAVDGVAAADLGVDEAVHLAAVDVGDRRDRVVRPARVAVVAVVVGPLADVREGVWDAALEPPRRRSGQALGARERAEVGVERPVLLHHHDHVLDLVNALLGIGVTGRGGVLRRRHAGAGAAACERDGGDRRDGNACHDGRGSAAVHERLGRAIGSGKRQRDIGWARGYTTPPVVPPTRRTRSGARIRRTPMRVRHIEG